jgi:low affinity Fe/Cu permease
MTDRDDYEILEVVAARSVRAVTSSHTLLLVFALFTLWLAAGPFLDFSDQWQLTMGTVSAATTFLMVFLLTRVQAKDSLALQIKLNEVIAALNGANNRLINIEQLSEKEIAALQARYKTVAEVMGSAPDNVPTTETLDPQEIEEVMKSGDTDGKQ